MEAILIGFMGSGKTTVGRLLAQQLQTTHADLDELIVARAGQPITAIFEQQGEAYFRQAEHVTLKAALKQPGILSTGGGTATIAANVAILMASSTPVIWLDATDATILARVAADAGRPLVNSLDLAALLQLKQQRAAWYAQAADLVISTDALTPAEICHEIVTWLAQPTQLAAQG
ncbi:shikimate kinase [Lactiplantibacillus sp. WILCCON 0030]|uniref:Shikimate kinase n=1 Tax=Lactiplantibacillus brownii TaxID=3069269 RepID=A0ABU1A7V8_9LACO|nr:shikimate kinase [Lactiplantibacillus brownii]MDQ7937032.1 shikimate kinase [Lactiplantibacillus brownii]